MYKLTPVAFVCVQFEVCKNSGVGFGWNILVGSGRAAKKRKAAAESQEEAKKVRFDDESEGISGFISSIL